jgi:hypothetical protein
MADDKVTSFDRSYDSAVRRLFSAQHSGTELVRAAERRELTVPEMACYVRRLLAFADSTKAEKFKSFWTNLRGANVTSSKFIIFMFKKRLFFIHNLKIENSSI